MKIAFSYQAVALNSEDTEVENTPTLRSLRDVELASNLSDYLDPEMADLGVVEGSVYATFRDGSIWIDVVFRAPERLESEAVEALRTYTWQQIEDGAGEGGFALEDIWIVPAAHEMSASVIAYFQSDDGISVPRPSLAAAGARDGDLQRVVEALKSESPDATLQGTTALQFSILYGHTAIARVLLSAGAKPDQRTDEGEPLLHLLGTARAMPDDDAAALARELIRAGCRVDARSKYRQTALELAVSRGKVNLAAVLREAGGD